MSNKQTSLPIDSFLPTIAASLKRHNNLIVSASPGAGKTTRVPVALSKEVDKQVWILEPRRIAAISSAVRICEENDWSLGQEVGYQVRFENRTSSQTKILFLTEALLLRKLKSDPDLEKVSLVILDEFHERSVHVDLALAALKELQQLSRPDLKIVVMSATLDSKPLATYLNDAPIIEVPGKLFPMEIIYDDKAQTLRSGPDLTERICRLIGKAVRQQSQGDLLCFLPGRGEIEWVRQKLTETMSSNFTIHSLHGQMSVEEQRAVLKDHSGQRKIILSTNIAESSLTIDGVRIVVDSGLVRTLHLDGRTGFESLVLTKVSKASATQRAGRSARQTPGVVYRAWTRHEDSSQKDFDIPEILRIDLAESLLLLASLGMTSFQNFSWFTPPSARSLQSSLDFLVSLGALDSKHQLTLLGQKMSELPVHPRWARLLIAGQQTKQTWMACQLAAVLTEIRQFRRQAFSGEENDIFPAWQDWQKNPSRYSSMGRITEQLLSIIDSSSEHSRQNPPSEVQVDLLFRELLFESYKDRLCRRRQKLSKEAKMVGGCGVQLHAQSSVKESEYFLAIEVGEGADAASSTVFTAVGLAESFVIQSLGPLLRSVVRVEWDSVAEKFWSVEGQEWAGLFIGSVHRRPAQPEEMRTQLLELLVSRWEFILQKNKELAAWWSRMMFLNQQKPNWPLLSEEQVRCALEAASYGEKSVESVESKDLIYYFEQQLSADHQQSLDKECPTHWVAPTGHRLQIQYSAEQGPFVEVRLQELFGLTTVPSIAGQSLTLFLLAPNYRPVQVTRDLSSFWKNGYPEVRKEMRARYPKHSWPEDPLTATPQAKGRPRQ